MYKIIIYKMIIFKIKQNYKGEHIKHYKDMNDYDIAIGSTGRMITKRYYQKVKTIHDIDIKELSLKYIEYKHIYKDSCYIFSLIKEGEDDWYFNNLNAKSEKAYIDYVKNGGGIMKYNTYWKGEEVYRNLFTTIIKPDDQNNVRHGYIRYIVLNDNNIVMIFACKNTDEPWSEYLKRKQ